MNYLYGYIYEKLCGFFSLMKILSFGFELHQNK